MAITNFQQTIWSKKIQKQLETITSLKDHCDFTYEGDIRYAKEVKILGVAKPTIRTYTPGSDITIEAPTDSAQLLKIDQFKYFAFEVDDVDKAQSVPGLIEALSREATLALSEEADKYVAEIIHTEAVAESTEIANVTVDISGVTDGGVSTIESAFRKLYENNVRPSESFHLEITPEWFTMLRPAILELDTNNSELIKSGAVGKYGNAKVYIENNLKKGATLGSQTNCTECLLRTSRAVAFAGQIDKVEAFRPEKRFSDAIKGLYVFGAKVVRPKEVVVIGTY